MFKGSPMKKLITLVTILASGLLAHAQCTADYDFGDVGFGVSPDPLIGEQFEVGIVGEAYEDVIHVLVPVNAGDLGEDVIPPEWADFASMIDIDSLGLVSVELLIDDAYVDISSLGLAIECNNNGDSSNPCTFLGGSQYCAAVTGTPNQAGVFEMRITANIYFEFFSETQEVPQTFEDDYFIQIDESSSISSIDAIQINVGQNSPNPFDATTRVAYNLSQASEVSFKVMNLLGETISTESFQGVRGNNQWTFDASELNAGIYLYSVEVGSEKITKRMIVR